MAVTKYLDYDGLLYFWTLIKGKLALKADKATTLSGYGITDAKISNGTITLGNNTITPITSITNTSLPDSGATAGTYRSVTVNAKGVVTSGTNPTTVDSIKVNSTAVTNSSGTVSIPNASTSAYGCTKLSSATNSTSTDLAATASAVKAAYDLANGKQSPATTLAGYGITDSYTKSEVDAKLASGVNYRGSVATYNDLPANPAVGDMYNVTATDENYIWAGASGNVAAHWDPIGALVNIAAISNSEIDTVVAS